MLFLAGVVSRYIWVTLDNLDDVNLQIQAEQITRYVSIKDGAVRLDLPTKLRQAYVGSGDGYLYAVLDASGRVLFSSSEKARAFALDLPSDQVKKGNSFFTLRDNKGFETPYFALLMPSVGHSDIRILVAQGYIHWDAYIESLLTEFAEHIGWTVPLIVAIALIISVWTIRSSLHPIKALSAQALLIGPSSSDIRLPTVDVANEILPLINAINSALDRLQRGFEVQRRFSANAAHELRTPLSILTARIGELEENEATRQLAEDVARMNRLVEQLLQVSRLDAAALQLIDEADLNQVAAEVVAYLAPLAIARHRSLALRRTDAPVLVKASTLALENALRNLIENALSHTPRDTEVLVTVSADGRMCVRDRGPGVPVDLRQQIFERFWRGRDNPNEGAGLGLAIVAETMRVHGGDVELGDAEGGGAEFTMRLPLARKSPAGTVSQA